LVKYEQHVEEGIVSLAPPWWGKPRIAALLASYLQRIQDVEDDLWEILDIRTLENADLPRLKILGSLIGQPRLLFSEEMYRKVLQARALANVSRGRASDILAVLEVLIGPGDYFLAEVGDATLLLSVLVAIDAEQLAALVQVLPDVRAAGVGFQLLFAADLTDTGVWGESLWGAPTEWGTVRVL
jgi:GNAT superfamily N-acetyltransferase